MTAPIRIDLPLTELPDAPAKLRILLTAADLFYDEGIRSVGVDRLIAASSVTKATFYKHYGSKDRVITAYIGYRHRLVAEEFATIVEQSDSALEVLHAVRDTVLARLGTPGFRGCPFLNAAAELSDSEHPARTAIREHREWYVAMLERCMRALGHPLAGDAADELLLAHDGALSGGYAGDPIAAAAALSRTIDRVIAEAIE